jgi:hypothetical protein
MTFTGNGGPPPEAAPNQSQLPQLNVLGQYVKDFSFENPNAPRSLAPSQEQPQLNVQINVGVGQASPTDYEVTLKRGQGRIPRHGAVCVRPTFAECFGSRTSRRNTSSRWS